MFQEAAEGIAFVLHSIELKEERSKTEEDVKKYIQQLERANIRLL